MINPTPADARELIDLAERMGIPTEDAIRRVVRHMSEPRRRLPSLNPAARAAPAALGVAVDE
jgi:hypothetical protein